MTDLMWRYNHTIIISPFPIKVEGWDPQGYQGFHWKSVGVGFLNTLDNPDYEPWIRAPRSVFHHLHMDSIFKSAQHLTVPADISGRCDMPSAPEEESCSGYWALSAVCEDHIIKISSPTCCTPSCCMAILSVSSIPLQTSQKCVQHKGLSSGKVHLIVN